MKIAGIIAEYNPFHSGHAWQIAALRRRGFDAVVCVCSPSLVQRGAPALLPAGVRAAAALAGGASLVLSLPAPYAIRSAEGFAAAGVRLLDALGCVDTLCFGADTLTAYGALETARLLEGPAFLPQLRRQLNAGLPLPAARAAAAGALRPGAEDALRRPNDILAVEYCRALLRQNSALTPLALPRQGAAHDAPLAGAQGAAREAAAQGAALYASASALRALAQAQGAAALAPYVPAACLALYRAAEADGAWLDARAFDTAVLSRLRALDAQRLSRVRGVREGLEHRLAAAARRAATWDGLIAAMQTKRYPTARLRRLALDAALGYTEALPPLPPYLHVLGADAAGRAVLREAKRTARLPLSHALARLAEAGADAAAVASAHAAAEDLFTLCLRRPAPMGTAYTRKARFI